MMFFSSSLSLLILIIPLLSMTACKTDKTAANVSKTTKIHNVEFNKVKQQLMPVILSIPGKVVAKNQLKIASRLSGYIEKILVDEGDSVKPGDMLVLIDNVQIEAAIKGASAAVSAAKAELKDAVEDVKRVKKLVKSKIAAEDDLRNADVRKIAAQANLATAEAELISKRKERRYVQLTSPVKAQVRERNFDPGDLATAGKDILLLDVSGSLELEVYLPSTTLGSITLGQSIKVVIDLLSEPLESKVNSIVHAVDDVTRRYKVRLSLPDKINVTAGQFGVAHIVLRQQSAIVIPVSSITQRAGIEGVFIIDDSNILRFRSVRLGKSWGDLREILAGLKPGDQLVKHPTPLLRDGDKTR